MRLRPGSALCVLVGLVMLAGAAPGATAVGEKVAGGSVLRDPRGSRRALHDFKEHKAIVLVFVGAYCPISNLYLPRLLELEKKYRPQQVQFLGIYPNDREDLEQISLHAYDRDVPFPML